MQTTVQLRTLRFDDVRTYLAATLFVIGNIILPQLCHFLPQGGLTWLPIYFFTLIGAYKYGWRVGLLTALASPVVNSFLFGMPPVAALPAIMIKSVLLALFASYAASAYRKVTLPILICVVLAYQCFGTLAEWVIKADFIAACQDFRIGLPGMLFQMLAGYFLLNHSLKADK